MEKLLKKLRKLLGKAGLEEEKIESIVSEVQVEDSEPDVEPEEPGKAPEEPSPEEPGEPTESEPSEPVGEPSEPTEPEPIGSEGDPVSVEPSAEPESVPEPTPEPSEPEVVPPAEEGESVAPVEPEIDYQGMYEELNKVVEAQKARIDSLEDALRKSNILRDEVTPVGVDNPSAPSNEPEDGIESTLAKFNRH